MPRRAPQAQPPAPPETPPPPLTVRQAAELMGVSTTIVYEACTSGRLRHFRHGQGKRRACIRIYRSDLDRYLESCEVGGGPIDANMPERPGVGRRRGMPLADDRVGEPLPKSLTKYFPSGWEKKFGIPVASG